MDIYRTDVNCDKASGRLILALLSDLHLDAADTDTELLKADLEESKRIGARISINGDIFDAIVPSDRKRHHPRVADGNRDDIFNHIVGSACSILSPYADLIDVISPGNHERSVLKYHHIDLVSMLVFALNQGRSKKLPPIHQGSYRGYQQYMIRFSTGNAVLPFTIFRHHGVGGSAPVTGGALDLDRIRKDFEADLYWIGHKHQQIGRAFTRYSLTGKGRLKERKQRAVISAGYKRKLIEEDPAIYGDSDDFGEKFYRVSEQGAQWVVVDYEKHARTTDVGFIDGIRWSVSDSSHMIGDR